MNLRVDLILESEQRSASVINAKSLTRMGMIIVPAVVGLAIAVAVVDYLTLRSRQNTITEQLEAEQGRKSEAAAVLKSLNDNKAILDEISGWTKSRTAVADVLLDVQKVTPLEIQLTDFSIVQSTLATNVPGAKTIARSYQISIKGKALADGAEKTEQAVLKFRADLQAAQALGTNVDEVVVSSFGASQEADAPKDLRIFNITCNIKPRKFR